MTLLIEMSSPNTGKFVLRLCVVDGDHAVLDKLLDEKVPQSDVLCPKGVGAISGNIKRQRVVDEERNTVEYILEPSSCIILL